MVYGEDRYENGINIIIAKTAKEAKSIGANCDATDDTDFIDIRVNAIKGEMSFHLYDKDFNEVTVKVGGKGYVYTEHKTQYCGLDNKFIDELKQQNRYIEEGEEKK
jgi:hypothetical protein